MWLQVVVVKGKFYRKIAGRANRRAIRAGGSRRLASARQRQA
jgi:hypothetical protein